MEARFRDRGTAPTSREAPFRGRLDPVPFPPFEPVDRPAAGGIPLHTAFELWYGCCQQVPPNGETNTNNPERENA
jgi:hypothetical protein